MLKGFLYAPPPSSRASMDLQKPLTTTAGSQCLLDEWLIQNVSWITGEVWIILACPRRPQINLSFTMGWIYIGQKTR